jgi:hypothetical protein
VFSRQKAATKTWKSDAAIFVILVVALCCGLVVQPSDWRCLLIPGIPLVLLSGWFACREFRHRNDWFEVDVSQIVYEGPAGRLTLAWDEIGEIREGPLWLTVRPKGNAAGRTLKIPRFTIVEAEELLLLIHRHCPAVRRASAGLVRLPRVFRTVWGRQVVGWAVTGVSLALAWGLLVTGEWPLVLLALFFLAAACIFPFVFLFRPLTMVVTTKGIVMLYPWRSRVVRHDEIDEIALTYLGVMIRSSRGPFLLCGPRDGRLAAYDVLLSAWESARQGKEQTT